MAFRYLVLDFDGTCTEIPAAAGPYLTEYHRLFSSEVSPCSDEEWALALALVRQRSPRAGWMLSGTPSAPAAADPYILAGEAAAHIARAKRIARLPSDLHQRAVEKGQALFRGELADVLAAAVEQATVWFISNSSTQKVENRLDDLLGGRRSVRKKIRVLGDAAKFQIREVSPEAPMTDALRELFLALPAAAPPQADLGRPLYLRRGGYMEALAKVWGDDREAPAQTLVCGDIYELDLALPAALGCSVHLIAREPPFDSYDYERRLALSLHPRGVSDHLGALLERLG